MIAFDAIARRVLWLHDAGLLRFQGRPGKGVTNCKITLLSLCNADTIHLCPRARNFIFCLRIERLSCRWLWPLKNKIEREAAILFEFRMVYQHRNSSRGNQYSFFWTFCCSFDLHGVAQVVFNWFYFLFRKENE